MGDAHDLRLVLVRVRAVKAKRESLRAAFAPQLSLAQASPRDISSLVGDAMRPFETAILATCL